MQSRTTFREGGEADEREKKGENARYHQIKKIDTNKLLPFRYEKQQESFFNALIFKIFRLLKIQPKYLLLTEINLVEGQNAAMWLW